MITASKVCEDICFLCRTERSVWTSVIEKIWRIARVRDLSTEEITKKESVMFFNLLEQITECSEELFEW